MLEKKQSCDEILFLSGIYNSNDSLDLTDDSINKNIQIAADVLQNHIINGLNSILDHPIALINVPFVGAYPNKCKVLYFKHSLAMHPDGKAVENIPFLNLPFLKEFSIYKNSKKYIKKWVIEHPNAVVATYALTIRNVYRLIYAKKVSHDIKTCMIVPDLPMYMRMTSSKIYKFAKKIENFCIMHKINKIDSFVLLTEYMNDVIQSKKYCIVEGISTPTMANCYQSNLENVVLYSGTLDKKYGILNLLDAFKSIKRKDVKLYICGDGDCRNIVEKAVCEDNRISFLGRISHDESLKLQSEATVLVNPRQGNEDFTKYSFPSKNLEYLSSGTPLIGYKLKGIPDEYDEFIYYVKDDSVDSLRIAIEEVLSYSPEKKRIIGESARRFVMDNKNERVQAQKIVDMLEQI